MPIKIFCIEVKPARHTSIVYAKEYKGKVNKNSKKELEKELKRANDTIKRLQQEISKLKRYCIVAPER